MSCGKTTHKSFYTQTLLHMVLLHIDAFTHRPFCTQTFSNTEAFTPKHFQTQKLLHADAFTHKSLYTQTLLHTVLLHTDTFTYRPFCTQTLLHTDAFTHRRFYTQMLFTHAHTLSHTNAFTHRRFYTQTLQDKDAFTHRHFYTQTLIEGSLEVKLPTIWRDEKQSRAEAERRGRLEERRERVRRQKIQMREKVGKSRNTVFFQWFVAPEGRKVGSLKRRVRSQLARGEMKNCTPLWREAHFQVKMYKTHHSRTTFGSGEVEKVHAVVARSTFPSQNVQNTSASDHFWKLRCQKSARRCGAKHISKSKCTKHRSSGPLLEVVMSKKCTPLWREAHFEVKM